MFCRKGVLRNFTRPRTLFKKRLWHRCFPVKFVKFLRTPFCIEHLWWLLLKLFTFFIHVDKKHIHTLSWRVFVHLKHIPHTILTSLLLFGTIKIPLNFEIYFTETDLQSCLINHNTTRVYKMKFHYQQCIRRKWRTTECFINLIWCNQSVTQNLMSWQHYVLLPLIPPKTFNVNQIVTFRRSIRVQY